jgi:luciferase family oxidoreductase group 1
MAASVRRLSGLDQAPIAQGSTGAAALRNSVDLARLADTAGYHRYRVAEHNGTPTLACASPEALIGPIAPVTSRLRVGSGGVMLPHYGPLQIAEACSMLAGLLPGRINLAVGRASGTDPTTTFALQRDRRLAAPDDFPEQIAELLAYLERTLPDEEGIETVAREYGADQVMVVTIPFDHEARRRSYELIAEAFDLDSARDIHAAAVPLRRTP